MIYSCRFSNQLTIQHDDNQSIARKLKQIIQDENHLEEGRF